MRSVFKKSFAMGILVSLALATQAQTVSPESVGLSFERLQRINALVQENIDAGLA